MTRALITGMTGQDAVPAPGTMLTHAGTAA